MVFYVSEQLALEESMFVQPIRPRGTIWDVVLAVTIIGLIAWIFVPALLDLRAHNDLKPGDELVFQLDAVVMSIGTRTTECIVKSGMVLKVETVQRFSIDSRLYYRLVPQVLTDMSHEACHPEDRLLITDGQLSRLDFKVVRK